MKNQSLNNRRSIWFFLGCMAFLWVPKITTAQTLTLQEILDSIGVNNTGLQQFSLKTKGSIAMGHAAKAWPAPEAGVGMQEFPYNNSKGTEGMAPRKMVMLRVRQMFPNFSRQRARSKYYQSLGMQNTDEMNTMKNMLFAQARSAFYDAVIAQKKKAVIAEQLKQVRVLIEIAKGRLPYDKADLPTIYNAQSRISDMKSNLIQLESILKQAKTVMNTLMNKPPDSPLQIDTSLSAEMKTLKTLRADSTYVLTHRSDIQLVAHKLKSIKWQRKAASSLAKPTFGISWDNMRMPGNKYMYNLMATVSIPVAPWSAKGYQSKVKALDFQLQAMKKVEENKVVEAVGNIQKVWLALQAQEQDVNIFSTEVIPAYQKTFQSNLNAFSENAGDVYKTLMAWDALTMKRMTYLDKLKKMFQLRVKLEEEMEIYE